MAQMPPAAEWFANIDSANTRRAYRNDLQEFKGFVGIAAPEEFRLVSRAHVLAWRQDLERRELAGSTLRRKLRRQDAGARRCAGPSVIEAARRRRLQQLRNRALLPVLFQHGLRREEVCSLTVSSIHQRRGVPHLRVQGREHFHGQAR
jgi:site-specific recombinase XerD